MTSRPHRRRRATTIALALALTSPAAALVMHAVPVGATPVARQVRVADTDWTSAAVGGIGSAATGGGDGTLTINGVSGTVTGAYLVWSGIGPRTSGQYVGSYDNPTITVNGTSVTGTSQGESGSNCWGDSAFSRTYLANVTDIVAAQGNGDYDLAGLGDGGDANGADLVVTFQDGDAGNDHDLYLFFGNDTDAAGYPGEDTVWSDALDGLNYEGGVARLQLGVADGQDFGEGDDAPLDITGADGTVSFVDDALDDGLWDGTTGLDAGHSRAANGSLNDLETFDVTAAFGDPGVQNLHVDSGVISDCHSLIMAAVDLQATGSQPPAQQTVSVSPASVVEGTKPMAKGRMSKMVFKVTLSAKSAVDTTVTLHTEDGTATAPADYRDTTRTVVIPAGKRAKAFKVAVLPDGSAEGDEYFYAVIESASVPIATGAALGEIVDDDTTAASGAHGARLHPATTAGARGGR